jgi:hypothetical protein
MKIRKAKIQDLDRFIDIKNQLSFKNINGKTTKGGFLLGTTAEQYKKFIKNEIVLVAEINNLIVGFGIVLKDETIKNSYIWNKIKEVDWTIDINMIKNNPLCYFEQLAFIPGYSRLAVQLCYEILQIAFKKHSAIITSTIQSPILNLASIPFILNAGGIKIGNIKETYPIIGNLNSDIYIIEKLNYESNILNSKRFNFLQNK